MDSCHVILHLNNADAVINVSARVFQGFCRLWPFCAPIDCSCWAQTRALSDSSTDGERPLGGTRRGGSTRDVIAVPSDDIGELEAAE